MFFSNGAAYCTGRGEIVKFVEPPFRHSQNIILVKPSEGLSTPEIFKSLGLQPGEELPGPDPPELLSSMQSRGMHPELCINDLEPPAFNALPALGSIKQRLQESSASEAVFMSGSGSTMLCWGAPEVPSWAADDGNMYTATCSPVLRSLDDWYGGYVTDDKALQKQ